MIIFEKFLVYWRTISLLTSIHFLDQPTDSENEDSSNEDQGTSPGISDSQFPPGLLLPNPVYQRCTKF